MTETTTLFKMILTDKWESGRRNIRLNRRRADKDRPALRRREFESSPNEILGFDSNGLVEFVRGSLCRDMK